MRQVLHPLFALLASITRQDLAWQIAYLKEENRILRSKLPKQITVTVKERNRLIKVGKKLGAQIKNLISIVTYGSFLRWVRLSVPIAGAKKGSTRKPCRPRTPDEIRELILKLARENDWGYTRILGALRGLRIESVSRQTVKDILNENGLEPAPERGEGTWDEFLTGHAQTLWPCDFATKRMWTIRGFIDVYFLVLLHLETRQCWISPSTVSPDSAWSRQQARNFLMHAEDVMLTLKYVQRDNDGKYTTQYDEVFESSGTEVVKTTPMSPNLRAHVERIIRTLKLECLGKFVIVSESHLNLINREFQRWYDFERPHSSRDFLPPAVDSPPEPQETIRLNDVVCETRLGGVLKSYSRRAA